MFVCSDIFHSDTLKQSVQLSADYMWCWLPSAYQPKLTLVLYEIKVTAVKQKGFIRY